MAAAAAPWPLWSAIVVLGVPGSLSPSPLLHGVLALCTVLALMVIYTHRPSVRSSTRWLFALVGTGLIGELLANAVTDMGQRVVLGEAQDGVRAIAMWLACVAAYEVAPIVAASSRIMRSEPRFRAADVGVHLLFLVAAFGTYHYRPTWGTSWVVSPWWVLALVLPLAAARSGPTRPARLPQPNPRGGVLAGAAVIVWVLLAVLVVGSRDSIGRSLHEMRWGLDAADGALLALPVASILASLAAAAALLLRAHRVRGASAAEIIETSDGGFAVQFGDRGAASIELDGSDGLQVGGTVTVLGSERQARDAGPFRDGLPHVPARNMFSGRPAALARALTHRAAGWMIWAAAGGVGLLLRLL